jgi:poly(A) polymerase
MTSRLAAAWLEWPQTLCLIAALGEENMRFVGGAVRDTLLGLPVSDLDVATQLRPEEVISRLEAAGARVIPTGLAHGTVTAVVDGLHFEVTTLRRDVATDGRRAVVAFSTDWKEDARRRDFTINALYVNVDGEVFDYFEGLSDLTAKRVRFIGDAEMRIREDALRILRFFRFQARYGQADPDVLGYAACVARRNDLMALSRERVRDELLKLLGTANPVPVIDLMIRGGIFQPVMPEIQTSERLALLVDAEQRYGEIEPLRRLAALLPKNGKILDDMGRRLKLSLAEQRRLTAMANKVSVRADTSLDAGLRADIYRLGTQAVKDCLLLEGQPAELIENVFTWPVPKFPLSGQALINRGVAPGPQVSALLKQLEQDWIESDFSNDPNKLTQFFDVTIK